MIGRFSLGHPSPPPIALTHSFWHSGPSTLSSSARDGGVQRLSKSMLAQVVSLHAKSNSSEKNSAKPSKPPMIRAATSTIELEDDVYDSSDDDSSDEEEGDENEVKRDGRLSVQKEEGEEQEEEEDVRHVSIPSTGSIVGLGLKDEEETGVARSKN